MKTKEVILSSLENSRRRKLLLALYHGGSSFTELKKQSKIENNATMSRDLEFFDSAGMLVHVFERTGQRFYSYYKLNSYGRKIVEIIIETDLAVEKGIENMQLASGDTLA